MTGWDFVVVGGGAAGAVLASRLSEDPTLRILLLEAGPARAPLASRIPAAFSRLFRTRYDWAYYTEPEPNLAGRAMYWPRGRLLGGSTAMNAMIWTRPTRADFDRWVKAGCPGWSYDDVAPYFDRAEVHLGPGETPARVGVPVSRLRSPHPIGAAFVAAALDLGLPPNDGFGDGVLEGVGWFRVSQDRGRRVSTADGYLPRAVRGRPNLTIITGARVTRVLLDGQRATGVEYRLEKRGVPSRATGRVLLAAGAIGSPHLLLHSGIGPARELEASGVKPVLDLPEVGKHLQDHLAAGVGHACLRPITLDAAERLPHLARYVFRRRGPLTSNVAEAGAFLRIDQASPTPDMELIVAPVYFAGHGFTNPEGHGYTIAAVLQRPASRGAIGLGSADPASPPRIRANYLSAIGDLDVLEAGLAWARRVAAHDAFAPFRGPETLPRGHGVLRDQIRLTAETLYHPAGTCRMGREDSAVVSERLKVHGLDDLWIADASVMPTLPTAHPQAPVVAIGERAAEFVRADAR